MVLYPQPTDVQQFEIDYANHLLLFHERNGIPATEKPYKVMKFLPTPHGEASFYQMFTLTFESAEELNATMSSHPMQEIAADANRISTGGAPTILIGNIS